MLAGQRRRHLPSPPVPRPRLPSQAAPRPFPRRAAGTPLRRPRAGTGAPRQPHSPGRGACLESLPALTRRRPARRAQGGGGSVPRPRAPRLGGSSYLLTRSVPRWARGRRGCSPSPRGANPNSKIPATPRPRSGRAGPRQGPPPEVGGEVSAGTAGAAEFSRESSRRAVGAAFRLPAPPLFFFFPFLVLIDALGPKTGPH